RLTFRAEDRHVAELRVRARLAVEVVFVVVALEAVRSLRVDVAAEMRSIRVLERAGEADLPIEEIVGRAGRDQVVGLHRSAEPFDAGSEADVRLDVLDRGPRAARVHREEVELVVDSELTAGVLDADVAQRAARVVRVVAAVDDPFEALRGAVREGEAVR